MKVLTFGELLLRLSSPGYSRLFQKDSLDSTFCGGEANVAVSLANYGIQSEFITKLPNNDVGVAASKSLKYFGVDTNNIIYGNGRMGLYYLEKGASQRASKVIYDRQYSAISMARETDFDWEKIFDNVDWFHWSGINPALSENMRKICEKACRVAKQKGITISCDLNYRGNLWSSEEAQSVMKELMKYVDVCIANEEDADKVLGIRANNSNVEKGELNVEGYSQVAQNIANTYNCKIIAITLRESYSASNNGWSGMIYDANIDKLYHSRQYNINIVDRVGGGDSFSAGIIYGLCMNMNIEQVLEFAVAASCLKHTIEGDYNRVTVDEVMDLVEGNGSGRVKR